MSNQRKVICPSCRLYTQVRKDHQSIVNRDSTHCKNCRHYFYFDWEDTIPLDEVIIQDAQEFMTTHKKAFESLDDTIQDRDAKYGGFTNVCDCDYEMSNAFHRATDRVIGYALEPYQIVAIDMILHKLARIACGDPNYVDNWHDIAGYATLVERELLKGKDNEV